MWWWWWLAGQGKGVAKLKEEVLRLRGLDEEGAEDLTQEEREQRLQQAETDLAGAKRKKSKDASAAGVCH